MNRLRKKLGEESIYNNLEKNLGINLAKEIKDLSNVNYK
jgi:hypothetical protein